MAYKKVCIFPKITKIIILIIFVSLFEKRCIVVDIKLIFYSWVFIRFDQLRTNLKERKWTVSVKYLWNRLSVDVHEYENKINSSNMYINQQDVWL